DHGRDPHRIRSRRRRRAHQVFLSRSFEHGDLRHHGRRAVDQARRTVRTRTMTTAAASPATIAPIRTSNTLRIGFVVMIALFAVAPFAGVYEGFLMKALCFALF